MTRQRSAAVFCATVAEIFQTSSLSLAFNLQAVLSGFA